MANATISCSHPFLAERSQNDQSFQGSATNRTDKYPRWFPALSGCCGRARRTRPRNSTRRDPVPSGLFGLKPVSVEPSVRWPHRYPADQPEGAAAALASAGLIQHEQTAALRLLLLTSRRCSFDVLAQILAERTFPVGSLALARYQAGERATGSGHARQQVQQGVDPITELRTRVAAQ